jgi:hypothetical protein
LRKREPFSNNGSQFLPFSCQFDELLGTDHLEADENKKGDV